MNKLASRRAFLTGRALRDPNAAMHPPGALGQSFVDLCNRCGDCIRSCPEHILSENDDGLPVVSFETGACTFCGNCAEACPTGALMPDRLAEWPWRAQIAPTCLSMTGVTCRTCQDTCDQNAIRFQLQTRGRATPVLDLATCTGCGACAASCPVGAVQFAIIETDLSEVTS